MPGPDPDPLEQGLSRSRDGSQPSCQPYHVPNVTAVLCPVCTTTSGAGHDETQFLSRARQGVFESLSVSLSLRSSRCLLFLLPSVTSHFPSAPADNIAQTRQWQQPGALPDPSFTLVRTGLRLTPSRSCLAHPPFCAPSRPATVFGQAKPVRVILRSTQRLRACLEIAGGVCVWSFVFRTEYRVPWHWA